MIKIFNPCCECNGSGEIEVQSAVDSFTVRPCDECYGNGYRVFRESYESAEEAAADYPQAIRIEEFHGNS
jgi:DnaJ-class molecular chaperone